MNFVTSFKAFRITLRKEKEKNAFLKQANVKLVTSLKDLNSYMLKERIVFRVATCTKKKMVLEKVSLSHEEARKSKPLKEVLKDLFYAYMDSIHVGGFSLRDWSRLETNLDGYFKICITESEVFIKPIKRKI